MRYKGAYPPGFVFLFLSSSRNVLYLFKYILVVPILSLLLIFVSLFVLLFLSVFGKLANGVISTQPDYKVWSLLIRVAYVARSSRLLSPLVLPSSPFFPSTSPPESRSLATLNPVSSTSPLRHYRVPGVHPFVSTAPLQGPSQK
jgi:hypothetical protein